MRSHVVKAAHSLILFGSLFLQATLCTTFVMAGCRRRAEVFTEGSVGLCRGDNGLDDSSWKIVAGWSLRVRQTLFATGSKFIWVLLQTSRTACSITLKLRSYMHNTTGLTAARVVYLTTSWGSWMNAGHIRGTAGRLWRRVSKARGVSATDCIRESCKHTSLI